MPWKPEYEETRRRKMAEDPEYRARVEQQRRDGGRTPEENAEYMREYYANNKGKWKLTQEQRDERNRRRRERYASDAEYRERTKASVAKVNPRSRLNTRLKGQFGITLEQYEAMLEQQGGLCAICGTDIGCGLGHRLRVDHCHATGKVRGLLCSECNLGLGKFRDNSQLLRRAAEYLDQA